MNIAEKILRAKADLDSVYDAGVEKGRSEATDGVIVEPLEVDANGTYTAPDGVAYSPVKVNVPDVNGSYNEGYEDGYEKGKAEGAPEDLNDVLTAQEEKLAELSAILDKKADDGSYDEGYNEGFEDGKAEGGGKVAIEEKDVNFYDYDGTLLYSYTLEEAQALTELPPAPTPKKDFLVFEEWNWSLAQIKDYALPLQVGAIYKTVDGKTRAVIRIDEEWQKNVVVRYSQWCTSIVVDWGDGSAEAPTTTDGGTQCTVTHAYAEKGEYTITVEANGVWNMGLNNSTVPFFGEPSTSTNSACALKAVYVGNWARLLGGAFFRASQLTEITIPKSATQTWSYVFAHCYNLKALIFPSTFTKAESYLANYAHGVGIVSFGSNVTYIGYNSLLWTNVTRISVPKKATNIAFNRTNIKELIAPEGVTHLDTSCCADSASLAFIELASTVTSISALAFYNTFSLMRLHFKATTPPTVANANAFTGIPPTCIVEVPAASLEAYKAATNYGSIAAQMIGV